MKYVEKPVDITTIEQYWYKSWPYKAQTTDLEYKTVKFGEVEFFTTFQPAKGKLKARILFVHGFAEYHKIYEEFYEWMSDSGYEVFFYDQRGAGLTSPGKFRGCTNDHYTFKDLDNFVEYNYDQKDPSIPLYFASHSMGGGIILNYFISGKHRDKVKGGICSAPLILLHPDTQPSIFLEKLVVLICKVKENILMNTKLKGEFLTTDKDYRNFLINDPLSKPTGTFGQLRDFIFRGRDLLKPQFYKKFDQSKSLLILHSQDDHINWSKGSQEFMDDLNKEFPDTKDRRKLIIYKGLGHSLLIESKEKRAEIYTEIVNFLDKDISV